MAADAVCVEDRRIVKTRAALREALIELTEEQGWNGFSINDLCERANINRGTFYNHYRDKDELMMAFQDEVLEQSPAAGSMVKEGRKVLVVLNTEQKPRLSFPGVIDNCSMREAEARIEAAGFNIVRVDTITGERDWVYDVLCEGRKLQNGEAVPEGSDVIMVVGNGKDNSSSGEPIVDNEYFD
jgi:hypothetical protein